MVEFDILHLLSLATLSKVIVGSTEESYGCAHNSATSLWMIAVERSRSDTSTSCHSATPLTLTPDGFVYDADIADLVACRFMQITRHNASACSEKDNSTTANSVIHLKRSDGVCSFRNCTQWKKCTNMKDRNRYFVIDKAEEVAVFVAGEKVNGLPTIADSTLASWENFCGESGACSVNTSASRDGTIKEAFDVWTFKDTLYTIVSVVVVMIGLVLVRYFLRVPTERPSQVGAMADWG